MSNLRNLIFGGGHTCPRWLCFTFDNPLRRLLHDPAAILGPHVSEGDRALDLGPGTGFFTIPLARLVGDAGVVHAADIQPDMLDAVRRRAERAGCPNVRTHLLDDDGLAALDARFDFALLFWMLHEVPDKETLLRTLRGKLADGGVVLLAEPIFHVPRRTFEKELELARAAGFRTEASTGITASRAARLIPIPDGIGGVA